MKMSSYLKGFLSCLALCVVFSAAFVPKLIGWNKQERAKQSPASSTADPFLGYWQVDDAKAVIPMEIDSLGANSYSLTVPQNDTGDRITFRTVRILVDGVDHVIGPEETVSVAQLSPEKWRLTLAKKGRRDDETYTLSPDNRSLTITSDNSSKATVLKRITGTIGFSGRWEGDSRLVTDLPIEISTRGADGLLLSTSHADASKGIGRSLRLDDQEYPSDSMGEPGLTSSSRRFDDHTIEEKSMKNHLVSSIDEYHLSADGNHLTEIIRPRDLDVTGVIHYSRVNLVSTMR